jgi:hypothetical protein
MMNESVRKAIDEPPLPEAVSQPGQPFRFFAELFY